MNLYLVLENAITVRQAISILLDRKTRVLFFVDDQSRVLGSFSEGDALRAIQNDTYLDAPVAALVHDAPITAPEGTSRQELARLFATSKHLAIPLVDKRGSLKRIATYEELLDV